MLEELPPGLMFIGYNFLQSELNQGLCGSRLWSEQPVERKKRLREVNIRADTKYKFSSAAIF